MVNAYYYINTRVQNDRARHDDNQAIYLVIFH